ncbi:hypothetical protein Btus_2034 [Kyrpidia tusciae DSM 2912]|uniref:Uncharacterized protein n=1 Tax=Kyrpidia tusciae (strain DSM 2912 / NBRC 15312 / T2) TaxID=562970 RepID=D5WQW5_KYRT2|nr:hypothetical protein Btus_2034 [Kyrpidia tusciae DSM 2912]
MKIVCFGDSVTRGITFFRGPSTRFGIADIWFNSTAINWGIGSASAAGLSTGMACTIVSTGD